MSELHGLTVRWSLAGAPSDCLDQLKDYVRDTSHARFSAMPDLAFKTWRSRDGEWFEGCYAFGTDAARDAFQRDFTAEAVNAPGSQIVGSAPVLIEACELVAVAEGGAGFHPSAAYVATQ